MQVLEFYHLIIMYYVSCISKYNSLPLSEEKTSPSRHLKQDYYQALPTYMMAFQHTLKLTI